MPSARILIVTDAWQPQLNGVVRTLIMTARELERLGHSVKIVGPEPETNLTLALPGYAEIRLEFFAARRLGQIIATYKPDMIHIATEGPLGWAARHVCLLQRLPFTTAYHTCFPEYVAARVAQSFPWLAGITQALAYRVLRHFHAPSGAVLVGSPSIMALLQRHRINPDRLRPWSRGVDTEVFTPSARQDALYASLPRPIALYVGRVAIEKNIRAFLDAALPGSKIVVGDGPQLGSLMAAYPHVRFTGAVRDSAQLAAHYATADVFMFPSLTDTFGLVILEALACGLPVAACPAPGPQDIFAAADGSFHRLDTDLARAARALLAARPPPELPRAWATTHYSWAACTQQFLRHNLDAPRPPRRKLLHVLLLDYCLSLPGQIYNYAGLRQIVWGARLFWSRVQRRRAPNRARRDKDDFGDAPP